MQTRTVPLAIFRKAATDHHHERASEGALPEFLQHRLMGCLWLSTLLAVMLVATAWGQNTPRIVTGTGYLEPVAGRAVSEGLLLLVPDSKSVLAPGQRLVCVVPGGGRLEGVVTNVAPEPMTLAKARASFSIGPALGVPQQQILRIAQARLDGGAAARQILVAPGGCEVLIKVGVRPLYSFLPLPGWLLPLEVSGE
jgi:hypothetical protein